MRRENLQDVGKICADMTVIGAHYVVRVAGRLQFFVQSALVFIVVKMRIAGAGPSLRDGVCQWTQGRFDSLR